MLVPTGYIYRADIWCPVCVVEQLIAEGDLAPAARDMGAEPALHQLAEVNGLLDEYGELDETTYDSDEFPKVIFDHDETCTTCGEEL